MFNQVQWETDFRKNGFIGGKFIGKCDKHINHYIGCPGKGTSVISLAIAAAAIFMFANTGDHVCNSV